MEWERKVLIASFSLFVLLIISIDYHIEKQNIAIYNQRTVFDDKLAEFSAPVFERVVPYVNKLVDYYGYSKIKTEGYSETVRAFDESVKRFAKSPKPQNFKLICEELGEIRKNNKVNTLKELIKAEAGPLTLAIYFLSPLPTTFKSNAQAEIFASKTIMNDKVLKYLAVLRLANVNRGISNARTWFEAYDEEEFAKQWGDVLSLKNDDMRIPELKSDSKSNDFDEILKASKADLKIIELKSKLRLDMTMEDFVNTAKPVHTPDVLVIKSITDSTFYYTQISEKIRIKDAASAYHLKAMIVVRKQKQVLIVFDEGFHFWTLFEDGKVLSIPRPFVRKYYSEKGTHLIYIKN